MSAEGAALCYRTICAEGAAVLGRHAHPQITMHTYPLADYMRPIYDGDWDATGEMLLASAAILRASGAEVLICPDNTLHQGVDLVRDRAGVPWLHIAEEIAAVAEQRGFRRLLVLGTKYLMEGPVYPAKLGVRGIEHLLPSEEERRRIDAIIFDELVYGRFDEPARAYFREVIARGAERGADAVILGCTEIPLLIGDEDSPLPTLDSTRTLARAALREATA